MCLGSASTTGFLGAGSLVPRQEIFEPIRTEISEGGKQTKDMAVH